MNERNQKIFKAVVWIMILVMVLFEFMRILEYMRNPELLVKRAPITQSEWTERVEEKFGRKIEPEDTEELLTGRYAALTSMDAIGDTRLSYITDEELTEEKKLDLALDYGIVKRKQLDREISDAEADEILSNTINFYCSPEYYPEYFDADVKVDPVNADAWSDLEYNEEDQIITAKIEQEPPEVGELIMFRDEYGIAQAKRVDEINEESEDTYTLKVHDLEDLSEIFDTVSFSGYSDFGYLTGEKNIEETRNLSAYDTSENPFITKAYAAGDKDGWFESKFVIQKDSNEETTPSCDLELDANISAKSENGKDDVEVSTALSVTKGSFTKKYSFSVKPPEEPVLTEEVSTDNGFSASASGKVKSDKKKEDSKKTEAKEDTKESDDKEEEQKDDEAKEDENASEEENSEEDDGKSKGGSKNTLTKYGSADVNAKIKGLKICTSGYYQLMDPSDEKNFVEVVVSADDIEVSSSLNMGVEDKYLIGKVPIPIPQTFGAISIDLLLYVTVGLDGELTIKYELDNPRVGLTVTAKDGPMPINENDGGQVTFKAKIELTAGLDGATSLNVVGYNLADPGASLKAYLSASTLEVPKGYKMKEGYSKSQLCSEIKMQAPILSIQAATGDDSLLRDMLNELEIEASIDLIEKDSDSPYLKRVTYHSERENDGSIKVTRIPSGKEHADICTHIEKKTDAELQAEGLKEQMEKELNERLEKEKKEAQERFEKMIEGMLDKFIMENCGGCE